MAKESNIVHQYFKKQFDDFTVMVKVDPIQLKGTEITIEKDGSKEVPTIVRLSDLTQLGTQPEIFIFA